VTRGFLERLSPAVSATTRQVVAAAVWSLVGTGLLVAGVRWLGAADRATGLALLAVALLLGWIKGRYVLARRAVANSERLRLAGDGRCIGGAFTWPTWLLVVGMMAFGAALRASPVPRIWLGVIYAAVGAALLGASVAGWKRIGFRGEKGAAPEA
jgi:hypothetical protein